MPRKVKQPVPVHGRGFGDQTPTIHVLDRFTASDLHTWTKRSQELEEIHHELYHGLEPERILRRDAIIKALCEKAAPPFEFEGYVRHLEYRYSHEPLTAKGSLLTIGGRFNPGIDCDESGAAHPFPALYIGDCHETACREAYGMAPAERTDTGLTPQELALRRSDAAVRLRGKVARPFDMRNVDNLRPVARIFAKFQVPQRLEVLAKSFKLGNARELLIRTPQRLHAAMQEFNWRAWPRQFGLPAPSQRFGNMLRVAGFDGVIYNSVRRSGATCVVVFPSNISGPDTFVELMDPAPPHVRWTRLDETSADELCGWDVVSPKYRAGLITPDMKS